MRRCLLDKVTARRVLEGLLKLAEARELTEDEVFTLDLYQRAKTEGLRLFIAPPTESVLQRLEALPRYAEIIRFFAAMSKLRFQRTTLSVGHDGCEIIVLRPKMRRYWLSELLAQAKRAAHWVRTSSLLLTIR